MSERVKPRHLVLATLLALMARARRYEERPKPSPGTFRTMPYQKRYGHRLMHINRQMRQGAYKP